MRYQPQGRVSVARRFADKVAGGWVGSRYENNAIGPASLIPTARFSLIRAESNGAEGVALSSNSATDATGFASLSLDLALTRNNFTLVGVLRVRAIAGVGVGARSNTDNILLWRNAGNYCFRVNSVTTTGPAFPLNTWLHYVLTSTPSGIWLSVNGSEIAAAAASASSAISGVPLEMFEDSRGGGAMDMDISMCALLSSGLARDEARSLSANAWQLFAAPEEDHEISAAGPGAQALIASRFDNAAAFYAPGVIRGAVGLLPARFDNSASFYGPSVTAGGALLLPARFNNASQFYLASLSGGATPIASTGGLTIWRRRRR